MNLTEQLKSFNHENIVELYKKGVTMYKYNKLPNYNKDTYVLGLYYPNSKRIHILNDLPYNTESLTIMHEWLHAYEDIMLDTSCPDDDWLDAIAYYHVNKNEHLLSLIREMFPKFQRIL